MTKKVVGNKNADYCVVSSGPDVCKVGNSFIPFDSYQQLSSEQSYVKSVRVNGVTTLTVGSVIKGTQSNAGSGIISGTSQGSGDCVITSGSPTVRFCGNAAAYHGSDVMMNNNNVPGLLYTVEKAAHIAKDAALIPVKKTEDMSYGEMMRLTNDNFFDSEQIAYQETPDVTLGFAKQAANSLIEFSESLVPLHDIEYQDADRIWMVPKGLRERREETTRAIAAHLNNPETAPEIFRFELENQSQKAGALVENVSEVAWAGKAGFSVVKNGIKALSLKSSKQATVTKNASIAAKPHNESATSAKKPECPVGSSVCRLDPVNVATGDFIQVWNVLSLPGIIPVYLQRTYRSTAQQSGLFGAKWSDNWSIRLDITDDEIIYSDPEGIRITYPILGEQLNIRHTHYAHVLLSGELEGSITLFDNRTQLTQHFDHHDGLTRRLSAITDNNQQRIDFHYDVDHQLSLITRNGQALLRLQYLQQQLQTITLVDSNLSQPLVTCHYDENGYLNECDAFQQNHLWHEYSSEGYMTRWYDTDQTDYYLEYDNRGRAIRNFSPSGYWGGGFIYDDIHQMTTFYDDEGGQSYYYYNDEGSVTHIIDPLGRESSTEWENNQKVSETNSLGETTRYLYHYDGNLAQIIFPDERSIEYQYNAQGQLTRYISPYGDEWQLNYDSHANLTTVTNPQGQVQTYEYSQHGELLKAIQPNGSQWQYEYNAAHQLIKSTNPYDNSTEFQFDELGRLQAYTDALNHTTRYRYSQAHAGVNGSLSELLLPDGAQQQIEYDSERRVVAVTDGEGRTTRYRYGPFDLVTSMVRPDSTAIHFEYDSLTRLKKVTSTLGETYTYERDRAGQIIRETDFTGRVLEYSYDRLGRRIATRFPDQHELRWRYAPSGVVIEQSEWLDNGIDSKCVSTTTYENDERLQLIRATNPDSVVEFEYDAQGRLCCERINGREIQHKWDDENQTLAHTRFGERELSYAFGQLGELTELQVNQHSPLQFSYNAVGQEYLRRSQTGFVSSSHYTPTGLLAEQRAGRGTENFLNSIRDNPHQPPIYGDVQRSFHYNRAQNVVAIEDSRWQLTQYGYNANDQIIETQFSNHYESEYERFQYDANLNLIEYSTVPAEVGQPWLLLSQQQQAGRIVRRGLHQGHQDCYYDRNGRLEKKVVHKNGYRPQEWRYLWNTQNQLTACFTPEGDCWRYVYDAFGRRLSKTKIVDMQAINEKPAFPLSKKRITGWHYLWSGDQMVEETPVYADGTIAYEASIQWLYQPGAITPAARYQYGTLHYVVADHQGTPREMFTEAGMAIWGGRLHTWGKLDIWQVRYGREEDDPNYIPCNFRFAGQYEDAETGLFYNRFRYYDKDSGQYISPDPIGLLGGLNPYGYVHNPVGWVDPFGLAGENCNALLKQDRLRRHHSSSAIYLKHTRAKTQEEAIMFSRGGKPAQYWDINTPKSKVTGNDMTSFRNQTEKEALRNGIYSPQKGGSDYYIYDSGRTIGFNNGQPTQYMRVEVTKSTNEFHGHPISAQDYNGYLKRID